MAGAPYRVIQWATGSVGREALRSILLHPAFELAAVLVHSEEKGGRDAGELCGAPATAILATTDTDAIVGSVADCVVYAPRVAELAEVCALLRSGKNVVCTPFLFHRSPKDSAGARRIEAACREGGSSLYGTGIHPGFVGTVLPIVLSGLSRTIDHIRIEERADWTFYDSPRITFDNMRFGRAPEEATLDANPFARFNADLFEQQVWMLSEAFGAGVEEVRIEQELTVAPESRDVRAGRLEAGTVSIEGDPSTRTHFLSMASFGRRNATRDEHVQAANVATAAQAVNAIRALCQAAPGWRSSIELGLVRTGIGFRNGPG